MHPEDFDRIVSRAVARIPARFRRYLRNVLIAVEPEPPSPGLLGLYEGTPRTQRSVSDPVRFPDRITIFQGPHERMSRSVPELEQHVFDTVWHEIAHFFGLDENEVLRAERRRGRRRR